MTAFVPLFLRVWNKIGCILCFNCDLFFKQIFICHLCFSIALNWCVNLRCPLFLYVYDDEQMQKARRLWCLIHSLPLDWRWFVPFGTGVWIRRHDRPVIDVMLKWVCWSPRRAGAWLLIARGFNYGNHELLRVLKALSYLLMVKVIKIVHWVVLHYSPRFVSCLWLYTVTFSILGIEKQFLDYNYRQHIIL